MLSTENKLKLEKIRNGKKYLKALKEFEKKASEGKQLTKKQMLYLELIYKACD